MRKDDVVFSANEIHAHTVSDTRYTVGVAGVIKNAIGQILLIKTAQEGLDLPSGRVERGEDLIHALQREVHEECGCQVRVGQLVGISSNTNASGLVLFTFACTHTGGVPRAADDSLDAAWLPPVVAAQIVTHIGERARLQDALADAAGVIYRVYDGTGAGPQLRGRYEV